MSFSRVTQAGRQIQYRLAPMWSLLRELATDDAYERYVVHHQRTHADAPLLTRRDFFLLQQQRKWSGIQRCC